MGFEFFENQRSVALQINPSKEAERAENYLKEKKTNYLMSFSTGTEFDLRCRDKDKII